MCASSLYEYVCLLCTSNDVVAEYLLSFVIYLHYFYVNLFVCICLSVCVDICV